MREVPCSSFRLLPLHCPPQESRCARRLRIHSMLHPATHQCTLLVNFLTSRSTVMAQMAAPRLQKPINGIRRLHAFRLPQRVLELGPSVPSSPRVHPSPWPSLVLVPGRALAYHNREPAAWASFWLALSPRTFPAPHHPPESMWIGCCSSGSSSYSSSRLPLKNICSCRPTARSRCVTSLPAAIPDLQRLAGSY